MEVELKHKREELRESLRSGDQEVSMINGNEEAKAPQGPVCNGIGPTSPVNNNNNVNQVHQENQRTASVDSSVSKVCSFKRWLT